MRSKHPLAWLIFCILAAISLAGFVPYQTAQATTITEYPIPIKNTIPFSLSKGSDGNIWLWEPQPDNGQRDCEHKLTTLLN